MPFNSQKYFELQSQAIRDRIQNFHNGRLYLEIGGQFINDTHAGRVLPGYDPHVKVKIIRELGEEFDLIFCVNSDDIVNDRSLKTDSKSYVKEVMIFLKLYEESLGVKPLICINKLPRENEDSRIKDFIKTLQKSDYKFYKRYFISGYPDDIDTIASIQGFGFDDYIEVSKSLVIVSGPASNSGKLSTCLGQIYHESLLGIDSGYAKYELFPIWNLQIDHPVNRAYEAATADIGDYNVEDAYHFEAYDEKAVNYNRDEEAFKILKSLGEKFVSEDNFIHSYKSPTDMGINMAGFCIEDDHAVQEAATQEIIRRRDDFQKLYDEGKGRAEWVERVNSIIQ